MKPRFSYVLLYDHHPIVGQEDVVEQKGSTFLKRLGLESYCVKWCIMVGKTSENKRGAINGRDLWNDVRADSGKWLCSGKQ